MKIRNVQFEEHAMGIPRRSLRVLRDELALRITHKIAVVEIPTSDSACGYLVLDRSKQTGIFTGDGFSPNVGGEEGAGHRSALTLFRIYNITPITWETISFDNVMVKLKAMDTREALSEASSIFQSIAVQIKDSAFNRPIRQSPLYTTQGK